MTRRPRSPSRRSPDADMEPSGKASAAAIPSRSGVSGVIFSGGGIEAMAQQHMINQHYDFVVSLTTRSLHRAVTLNNARSRTARERPQLQVPSPPRVASPIVGGSKCKGGTCHRRSLALNSPDDIGHAEQISLTNCDRTLTGGYAS
jgi:hypothetical protein